MTAAESSLRGAMAQSSCKPRLGWLALAVIFLLHAHYNQPFLALAGETDDDGASQHSAIVSDQKAGLRGQGMEATLGETVTDADLSTVQGLTGEDKASAALNEDEVDVKDQPVLGKYHFRGTQRARAACGFVATVLALTIVGRLLVSSGSAALRKEITNLKRLEALVPVAEKLCVVVGTPQSRQLFKALEALLPDIRQALSEAETKLKGEGSVRIRFLGKPYQETMSSLQDLASQTSKAIRALHKNARRELTVSKRISVIQRSGFGSFEGQIERLMGADYAKAFITTAESQEALVDEIVQAYKDVLFRSSTRPFFSNHRDGHLLIETIRDFEVAEGLANARDTAQTFMERLEDEAHRALQSTVRQDIKVVMHEHEMLIKGLKTFLKDFHDSEHLQLKSDIEEAEDLWKKKIIPALGEIDTCKTSKEVLEMYSQFCGAADEASKVFTRAKDQIIRSRQVATETLLKAVSDQMKEISLHAKATSEGSTGWQEALNRDYGDTLDLISHCKKVSGNFSRLKRRLTADLKDAAEDCKQLHKNMCSQGTTDNIFKRLLLVIREDSKAGKAVKGLAGNRGNFFLAMLLDEDIVKSLKTINALDGNAKNYWIASAKFITSKRRAIANDVEALKDTESLSTVAETAARLRNTAHLIQLAIHTGVVPQIQEASKVKR